MPGRDASPLAQVRNSNRGASSKNPFELLASLKQNQQPMGTYVEQSEVLLSQIGDLPEDQGLDYFLSGLCDDIRRRVITHGPITVIRAMDLFQNIEDKLYRDNLDHNNNYTIVRHKLDYILAILPVGLTNPIYGQRPYKNQLNHCRRTSHFRLGNQH